MRTIAINKPRFDWLLIECLAAKYHVRAVLAGQKVVLRAPAGDLVRMVSAIKVLEGY